MTSTTDSSPPPDPAERSVAFATPPQPQTADGQPRRVGCELELAGIDLQEAAAAVGEVFGGEIERESRHRFRLESPDAGRFTVELDWRLLSDLVLSERLGELGLDEETAAEIGDRLEELVGRLASTVVPVEIVTPPLPPDELPAVERLRAELQRRGALGTGASLAYAFGLHLNPEVPALDAATLLGHLRAFLVLYEWLADEVDLTRRLTPYINPFPTEYAREVLAPGYRPSMAELAKGYLRHNPTRNRPLDLLPALAEAVPELVAAALDEPLLSPRPAFHYRLPGCRVDDPAWRIADEWNRWVEVERLAADGDRLESMADAYRELLASPIDRWRGAWRERLEEWR